MDGGTQQAVPWTDYAIFIGFIVLVIAYSIYRRKKQGSTRLQMVTGLLTDMKHNTKVIDAYARDWKKVKKLRTGNWKKFQDKIDFLEPDIMSAAKETFTYANAINEEIERAEKNKATTLLSSLPMEKMREPMNKAYQGIVEWLKANLQTEMYSRRRGLFG